MSPLTNALITAKSASGALRDGLVDLKDMTGVIAWGIRSVKRVGILNVYFTSYLAIAEASVTLLTLWVN
jgi:hypothetical protein